MKHLTTSTDGDDASPPSRLRSALLRLAGRQSGSTVQVNEAHAGGTVISTQNGSITVQLGDGRYRLVPFDERRLIGPGPADQPSQLLAAANAVVPFWGRRAEQRDLRHWRDRGAGSFAIRLLHGPAGQGKTRLAHRFAEVSRAEGWQVLRALRDPGSSAQASRIPVGRNRRLIIVDYADRWPCTDLIELLQNPNLSAGETRVLLLARSARWWQAFVAELHDTLVVPADAYELSSATADRADLSLLYRHAWTKFAGILRLAGAPGVPSFPRPARDTTVLDVLMTALADVYARIEGVNSPTSPLTLSAYLLDRERAHWIRLQREQPGTTRHETIGRTVLLATLLDRLPLRTALNALRSAGLAGSDADGQQIVDDHARLYPPVSDMQVMEPLIPDRLGEDFVGLESPGHPLPGRAADPWAADLLACALTVAGLNDLPRSHLRHAVLLFTNAAVRWPHLARRQLLPLLREHPAIALWAGAPAIAALLELPDLDAAVMQAILAQLPGGRSLDYVDAAAELAGRLAEILLRRESDPRRRADIHHMLGVRLLHARKYTAAKEQLRSEVDLRRTLAVDPHDSTGAEALAQALALLAEALAALREYSRALDAAGEAQRRYLSMPHHDDERLAAVARTTELNARLWSRLGYEDQAVEDQDAAVEMWRRLSAPNALYLPSLAQAQDAFANYLRRANHPDEAVRTAETAIQIWRGLATLVPALYEARLAISLDESLQSWEWNSRRLSEYLAETIGRFRTLMRGNIYFQVRFCRAATRWARLMSQPDHRLALLHEAVGLADELVRVNPEHYRQDKAELLLAFAQNAWWTSFRLKEGQLAAEEALELFRLLAAADPQHHYLVTVCERLRADILRDRRQET